jgi:hypothetical protein
MRDNQGTNPWRKHSNRVFAIVRDQYISGIKGCVKVLTATENKYSKYFSAQVDIACDMCVMYPNHVEHITQYQEKQFSSSQYGQQTMPITDIGHSSAVCHKGVQHETYRRPGH